MRLPLLAFLLLCAPVGAAQERGADADSAYSGGSQAPARSETTAFGDTPPLALVSLGAATGYVLGAGAGYGVGLAMDGEYAPEDLASEDGLLGAVAGASVGVALGAHLANGRRGSLWLSLLASAAAQGLYTYAITRDPLDGRRFALVLGIPLVGTATSVAVERLTSR